MSQSNESSQELAEERTDLSQDRTDWAEDRTVMANERTFAGWMRTGLAAVGIGLGFNAIFGKIEPAWLPKLLATVFIGIGIVIFWLALNKGAAVHKRLDAHSAKPIERSNLKLIAVLMSLGSVGLAGAVWIIKA